MFGNNSETKWSRSQKRADSPWAIRDYRVWFTADTSLLVGAMIGGFAFSLLGYTVSHDTAVAGTVAAVYSLVSGVSTLIGGRIIDRIDRKKLMVAAGLTAFAVLAVIIGVWVAGAMSVPVLFALAVLRGVSGGLFSGVTDAALPQIVSGKLLVDASAANNVRTTVANMLASPLSGWLYAFGPEVPFALAAVMYLGLAASAPFIRANLDPKAARPTVEDTDGSEVATTRPHDVTENSGAGAKPETCLETPHASEVGTGSATGSESAAGLRAEGGSQTPETPEAGADGGTLRDTLRWYAQWPQVSVNGLLVILINFAFGLSSSILILQQQAIGTATALIGMISMASGVSSLFGSLLVEPMTKRFKGGRVIQLGLLPTLVGYAGMVFTDNVWVVCGLCLFASLLMLPMNAVCGAYFMLLTPNAMMGRVNSMFAVCSTVASSLASALSGLLLKYLGYSPAMAVGVAMVFGAVALTWLAPAIREIPFRSDFDAIKPLPLK